MTNSVDYGYKTQWRAPGYHVVNGKIGLDRCAFYIQKNDDKKYDLVERVERHPIHFRKYADRPPIADEKYPPHASRFENIDKSPAILTKNKHMRSISFAK